MISVILAIFGFWVIFRQTSNAGASNSLILPEEGEETLAF